MKRNVSQPIIALAVDVQPMGQVKHVAAPPEQFLATWIKQNNGVVHNGPVVRLHEPVGSVKGRGSPHPPAAMEHRDVAIRINGNG